ncbi:MAG: dihydroorotase family protein [Chloroflexi bacterium]|nr:dihydroorotase family protein [Chloroflexota bacterium]
MARMDLLVTGGKVVTSGGVQEMDVAVKDGRIAALVAPGLPLDAARTFDARARYILPGCVDVHVHTREPGQAHKEDFATLTRAAAAGGITTIMCQPNTSPPINNRQVFHQAQDDWRKKALVDFAIQPLAEPGNVGEIPGLLEAGAISMEFLTADSTGPVLPEIMQAVHQHGGLSSISMGDGGYSQFMRQRLELAGGKDMAAWLSAYPAITEAVGVARLLLLTEGTPYRFHFHMVTTRQGVELIRRARQAGRDTFSVETSPKYLLLTEEDHLRMGPFSTVLPRFKSLDDNEAVWEGILDGTIDMIATDHAPHARAEKERGLEDIWKAPSGVPEIELSLPLMLTQVNRGRLSLGKLVALMAENPARKYGIYPQKGSVQVGADADLVIVAMERETVVDDAKLLTAPKYSAFHGFPLKGLPVVTILRGEVIMEEGKPASGPPRGRFVRPGP